MSIYTYTFATTATGNVPASQLDSNFTTAANAFGAINVRNSPFNAVGDGVTDDTAALAAACAYMIANNVTVIFPAGTYLYTVSPNWAFSGGRVVGFGTVTLKYRGVGNAVIIDAGSPVGAVYDFRMGRFNIDVLSTAGHGVYVRSVHHSRLEFNVRGAGSASAGMRVDFAVCTDFPNFTCSNNEGAWTSTTAPLYGLWLDQRAASEECSYCTFQTPIIEGLASHGIYMPNALGNSFIGGTSESNTGYGAVISAPSRTNRFFGTDFEANTAGDIDVLGYSNEFHGVDSDSMIIIAGASALTNKVFGGNFRNVVFDAGSKGNQFTNAVYNRYVLAPVVISGTATNGSAVITAMANTTGVVVGMGVQNVAGDFVANTFVVSKTSTTVTVSSASTGTHTQNATFTPGAINAGTYNGMNGCVNVGTNTAMPATNPPVRTQPTVGASPWTYTNNSGNTQFVYIIAGTITNIQYGRGAVSDVVATLNDAAYTLKSGDFLIATYTVAPTCLVWE